MANEIEIINNPDLTPGPVSTGYQRQNTRMVAASVGMDASIVEGGSGQVTALISGPIDVNGVLYTIKAETVLVPVSAGRWYIYLEAGGSVSYLTPTLTDDPGTYDETKFARYTSGGKRILNWLIDYDGTTCRVSPWKTPEYSGNQNYLPDLDSQPETWITASGTWTAPRSKYYTIWVTGKGGDGGSAASASILAMHSGGGGGAGLTGLIRKFINAGDTWTAVFGGTYVQFSDGTTTLQAYNGTAALSSPPAAVSGIGATSSTGFDEVFPGGDGVFGHIETRYEWAGDYSYNLYYLRVGGVGGASYYGGGAAGGWNFVYGGTTAQQNPRSSKSYGSGGGGAAVSTQSPGSGCQGVIRIVG